MRYALVTETWPPEVNGVALTVQGLARGLASRGHGEAQDGGGVRHVPGVQ